MIALTQEKREELANYARARLASHVLHGGCSDEEEIFKIALAAITAVPFGWEIAGNIFPTLEEALKPGYIGTPEPIYDEPPVSGIKLPELIPSMGQDSEYDSGHNDGWNNCLAEIKRLNGLGE
ncbi:hypothetical protein [Rosenbergiella australiborealis]|uniref:hypothetical protein n=1 Tax=Rosenbergiella australiborealis TaxID=1544696 RepID=UPI001F4DCA88|nr:hypothetical protein [Rosenbergiella australiborealis]